MKTNEEILPLVDESDEIIGSAAFSEVHKKGILHREVYVYVINSLRQILLQRRNDDGLWDHSAAGHFGVDETYLEGAQRELREEVGLNLSFDKFKEIGYEKFETQKNSKKNSRFVKIYLVKTDLPIEDLVLQDSEVLEVKYFNKQEIESLCEAGKVRNTARKLLSEQILKLI